MVWRTLLGLHGSKAGPYLPGLISNFSRMAMCLGWRLITPLLYMPVCSWTTWSTYAALISGRLLFGIHFSIITVIRFSKSSVILLRDCGMFTCKPPLRVYRPVNYMYCSITLVRVRLVRTCQLPDIICTLSADYLVNGLTHDSFTKVPSGVLFFYGGVFNYTLILDIGATGNIGLPHIQALTKRADVQLFAAVTSPATARATLRDLPVQLRKLHFLHAATLHPDLAALHKVFFVRPPQLAKPKTTLYHFLHALVRTGIKQVVFVSLLGVTHNPNTPTTKITKRLTALGLHYNFIRPSFLLQNLNTTTRTTLVAHTHLFVPAGRARTSLLHTRTLGAVAATVL